ncbi:MAG: DUF1611 domain-containing protein [Methanomassiliicoccales archaeon]|nr:DUF1611 domain-containing protein [Methanomassiliicoccales archaeon]
MNDALVLCEGKLGTTAGKTARGLVRYSRKYRVLGVIDSTNAGRDAGEVVDGIRRGIPVFSSLSEALERCPSKPEYLIIGVATIGGMLPKEFRPTIREALENGISVISGLHEFLAEDKEFLEIAKRSGASIVDIRKEPPLHQLHKYKNLASKIQAVRIPVLGTDAAIGKRTTAIEITEGLNRIGVKSEFVATGQTGLLQGARYGVPLDAIQGDYMVGELEHAIYQAWLNEKPDVIIVEGQGSLTHPVYVCGTRAIISATKPDAIIIQHAPGRKFRTYDPELKLPMPDLHKEIALYEAYSNAPVIGLGINHEGLSINEVKDVCRKLEAIFGIPAVDVFLEGSERLVRAIIERFPFLKK